MEVDMIMTTMRDAIYTMLLVSLPLLGISLIVGVLVSIMQAATQINEQTLSFIPKLVAIFLALLVFGGWIGSEISDFLHRLYDTILKVVI